MSHRAFEGLAVGVFVAVFIFFGLKMATNKDPGFNPGECVVRTDAEPWENGTPAYVVASGKKRYRLCGLTDYWKVGYFFNWSKVIADSFERTPCPKKLVDACKKEMEDTEK